MIFGRAKNGQNDQRGFSLLEMLIAIFLFAVMAVAVSGVYVAFTNLQARARSYERLLNDSNYALELMSREFRTGSIFDYNLAASNKCVTLLGAASPQDCIIFIRSDNTLAAFMVYTSGNNLNNLYYITPSCDEEYTSCADWTTDVKNYTILLSTSLNGIRVANNGLFFKISPSSDPFLDDAAQVNRQPMITLQLHTEYLGLNNMQQVDQSLQTTVSARIYRR